MRAADGLRDDLVDQVKFLQILSCQPQGFG